ncbi:fluoride efflux transporter CrcB [Eggerthellaceae bacterium zg-1084]|uniref:Fluoride-specific ion channel FluC n=1 Tax=Berryella wangjianweii TaxID=2734634 RepID=A0A6M8J3E3_9ACTN|nr:fluoride efflux transporter CrcB [Berryella wangjianweii]QKF08024.1 fluoride efflux transporter CrcB [Berryella wangjianweii]
MLDCLAVGVGGFVGSVLRYLAGLAAPSSSGFPVHTLLINVAGSFALALIAGLVLQGLVSNERLSLLLRVGLCGGFTTFSTFSFETMSLMGEGQMLMACAYAALSVALCVAAAFAGTMLARML